MNHTAEPAELAEFPSWQNQVMGWQERLAAIDWRPWLIVALAAALRFFLLGIKPPHFDEGINGWFVDQMVKSGFYRYDPTNYHGPLHFYVLFMFQTLFGRNIWALRFPVVIVSIACVWLTLRYEPIVGTRISRWAAITMAVSPGFVFYGRYSIHEVWMQFSSMLMILGLLGLWRLGTRGYLWCAGMGLTGMILTKETYVIHAACAVLAMGAAWVTTFLPRPVPAGGKAGRSAAQDLVVVLSCLTVVAFFLPWAGPAGSAVSGPHVPDLGSAGGAIWLIVVAAIGCIALSFVFQNNRFLGPAAGAVQFLTIIYMCGHLPDEVELGAGGTLNLLLSLVLMASVFLPRHWTYLWTPRNPAVDAAPASQRWDYFDLAMVIAVGAILVILFYSGMCMNWSGLKGLYQAYGAWVKTGQEGHSGHEKPWNYWLKLICRYEWPVLVGLVVCFVTQFFKNISLRYLAIYGVGTLIAYSIVHYKTPWCIISIVWPFLFTFGGLAVLVPKVRQRAVEIAMAVLVFISLCSSISLNYFYCSTFQSDDWDSNKSLSENLTQFFAAQPYVYVQTYNDIFKLTRPVLTLAHRDPAFYQMIGHMIRNSSYPLPWIFDDFPNVGYYEHDNLPPKLDADFLLVEEDKIKDVESKLQDSYYTMPLTIRPYQDTSKLYLDAKRFREFFPGQEPDFKGKGPG